MRPLRIARDALETRSRCPVLEAGVCVGVPYPVGPAIPKLLAQVRGGMVIDDLALAETRRNTNNVGPLSGFYKYSKKAAPIAAIIADFPAPLATERAAIRAESIPFTRLTSQGSTRRLEPTPYPCVTG